MPSATGSWGARGPSARRPSGPTLAALSTDARYTARLWVVALVTIAFVIIAPRIFGQGAGPIPAFGTQSEPDLRGSAVARPGGPRTMGPDDGSVHATHHRQPSRGQPVAAADSATSAAGARTTSTTHGTSGTSGMSGTSSDTGSGTGTTTIDGDASGGADTGSPGPGGSGGTAVPGGSGGGSGGSGQAGPGGGG
jgi:hypothetical protein